MIHMEVLSKRWLLIVFLTAKKPAQGQEYIKTKKSTIESAFKKGNTLKRNNTLHQGFPH